MRRHPHIFGDVEADTVSEVMTNWEQIKKREKGSDSIVEGISPGLASLLYAHKLYRKAASVGLEPGSGCRGARSGGRSRSSRCATPTAPPTEAALGDLLAAAVVLARSRGVDAETSLRGWSARFRDRFVRMEQLAGDAGGRPRGRADRPGRRALDRGRTVTTEYTIQGRTVSIPVEVLSRSPGRCAASASRAGH